MFASLIFKWMSTVCGTYCIGQSLSQIYGTRWWSKKTFIIPTSLLLPLEDYKRSSRCYSFIRQTIHTVLVLRHAFLMQVGQGQCPLRQKALATRGRILMRTVLSSKCPPHIEQLLLSLKMTFPFLNFILLHLQMCRAHTRHLSFFPITNFKTFSLNDVSHRSLLDRGFLTGPADLSIVSPDLGSVQDHLTVSLDHSLDNNSRLLMVMVHNQPDGYLERPTCVGPVTRAASRRLIASQPGMSNTGPISGPVTQTLAASQPATSTTVPTGPVTHARSCQNNNSPQTGSQSKVNLPALQAESLRISPPKRDDSPVWGRLTHAASLHLDSTATSLDLHVTQLPEKYRIPELQPKDPRLLADVVNLSGLPMSSAQLKVLNSSVKF